MTKTKQNMRPINNRAITAVLVIALCGSLMTLRLVAQKNDKKQASKATAEATSSPKGDNNSQGKTTAESTSPSKSTGKAGSKPASPKTSQAKKSASGAKKKTKTASSSKKAKKKRVLKKKVKPIPYGFRRYRVLVAIRFAPNPLLTNRFRKLVIDRFKIITQRTLGEAWKLTISEDRFVDLPSTSGLQRLTAEGVKEQIGIKDFDKAFFLTVDVAGAKYSIAARGWDRITETLGIVETATTYQRRTVADDAFRIVQGLFDPIVEIDHVEDGIIEILVMGGEYGPFDLEDTPSFQLAPGVLLRPMLRYLDKEGELRKIQPIPWTYLDVNKVDRSRGFCEMKTGVFAPITGKRRRRVEALAIVIKPKGKTSRLRLRPYRNPTKALVGYNVTAVNKLPRKQTKEEKVIGIRAEDDLKPIRMLTDRWGDVNVPVDPEHGLRWLYIRNGKSLLARVPFVPGIDERVTLTVPDDSLRLSVEGDIEMLMNELIDTVAGRAVSLAMIDNYLKKKNWKEVDKRVPMLDEILTFADYEDKLDAIRYPALKAAEDARDKGTEKAIKKLCKTLQQVMETHLNNQDVDDKKELVKSLREAQKK